MSNSETLHSSNILPVILFEDTHLLVISKPAGLLSQGEHTGDPNVVDWARAHVGRNYIGLIHRLDRNTSGLLILAKRSKAANRLTEQLKSGVLSRDYLAWVQGSLKIKQHWRHWLLKNEKTNTVQAFDRPQVDHSLPTKEASLWVAPLEESNFEGNPITLAHFSLETGRSHQIRAQAAAQNYPLLGDRKYGGNPRFERPALHSWRASFEHPMTQEKITLTAPLPADLRELLRSPQNPSF